ncbi:MAG TPA: DUF4081 domain-containing protein [Myxococcaceae bacterium]|nr:DUF4081 domain-containing protein [Myxococcaceae bacterium]
MSVTVEELGPKYAEPLRTALARDISHNLYLLGFLEELGIAPRPEGRSFAFWGAFRGEELRAALLVDGDRGWVMPSASDVSDVAAIARHLEGRVRARVCVGDASAVDPIIRFLFRGTPRARIAQRLFAATADDLGPFTNPTLRLATEADLAQVVAMAAACVREVLGRDPLADDPAGYPARVLERIRSQRTWILVDDGRVVFKVDVASRSRYGVELEAPYTLPYDRGRGHATHSLGQLSRHLLSSLSKVTLRVDERNTSLASVVRKVGYVAGRPQQLVSE